MGTNVEALCHIEKKRTQPFLVIIGNESTLKFEQFFVMAERKVVVCNSFLQALDSCFKLYHIMNASFPSQCKDSWEFISSFFFSMTETKGTHLQLTKFLTGD